MAWIQPNIQQPPQPNIIQQQQACWSSAMRGDWKPAQHEMRAHSYTIANDAGGWRSRDLPYARRRWEHYKWTPSAASGLRSIPPVSRERWCEVMRQQRIKRFAIVGDSINWSMIQSLWKLLSLNGRNSDPPGRRPPSRLLTVDCSGRTVELLWAGSNHLNASLIAETVATSDVTLINGGPWYSPANAAMNERYSSVLEGGGRSDQRRSFGKFGGGGKANGGGTTLPSTSTAWRLFVGDLIDVHKALQSRSLPDRTHKLIWRTSPTGHPNCHNHTVPLANPGAALDGLLACRECIEAWAWHTLPTLDRAARDRLGTLGALAFDIRPMSSVRPDAHTEHQYAKGKYDCLHYALPGVPDWWSALLLSTMEACGT